MTVATKEERKKKQTKKQTSKEKKKAMAALCSALHFVETFREILLQSNMSKFPLIGNRELKIRMFFIKESHSYSSCILIFHYHHSVNFY